jgi:uncharacterized protein (TIGR02444 family)
MTSDELADKFWAFSLRLYADAQVKSACLKLQDEAGLNVNCILLCLFAAQHGRAIDFDSGAHLRRLSDPIDAGVLQPLRQARKNLTTFTNDLGEVEPSAATLVARFRTLELDAERLHQARIAPLLLTLPTLTQSVRERAIANLIDYADASERTPSESMRSDFNLLADRLRQA